MQSNGSLGQFFIGIVEDRNDPLKLGRCRVRVVGLHIHDKEILPTEDLPWAMIMMPTTSASSTGIGVSPVGPIEGTTVIVIFHDYPDCQQPIVIGSLSGISQKQSVVIDAAPDTPVFKDDITPQGRPIPVTANLADGGQVGPTTGPNPLIATLQQQSTQTSKSTSPSSVMEATLLGTAASNQSIGNLAGSVGGLGTSEDIAASNFEATVLSQGSYTKAIQQFQSIASKDGGSVIAQALQSTPGLLDQLGGIGINTSLLASTLQSSSNIDITIPRGISDQLNAIKNVSSSFNKAANLLNTVEKTAARLLNPSSISLGPLKQAAATLDNLASSASSIKASISQATQQVVGSPADITKALDAAAKTVSGSIKTLTSTLQTANPLPSIQSGLSAPLPKTSGSSSPAPSPAPAKSPTGSVVSDGRDLVADSAQVAATSLAVLSGDLSSISGPASATNGIADIKQLSAGPDGSETREIFAKVPEGSTPPIFGAFGGPNAAGQAPAITVPQIDMSRYSGGSELGVATEPPSSWKGNRAAAIKGIAALLAACDKYGFNTNEQKAALLGIVGGECGWIPQSEIAQYSRPERLCEIFHTTFKQDLSLAEKYCNWIKGGKGSPDNFFDFVYDPSNNGRQLGNTKPGDGSKFHGRGFLQLTGRANYERYAQMSGIDIVNNPDILNTDVQKSAEIAVLYLKDRTKTAIPTAHPGFFHAAKKAVGNNSPDIAQRKLEYYEHFYKVKTLESYGVTEKTAGSTLSPYSYQGAVGSEDSTAKKHGFRDPNNKYPLKRYVNEPDTNRLARGVAKGTVVMLKDSKRTIGVPKALNMGSWSQPTIPFGAVYPHNKVMETESGHIQEFDDTPGYERIHTYHRKGTFQEWDANGTEVKRIVGDKYTIIDRNGHISIDGECSVTVGGNVNIYCRSDAHIEVAGSAEMKVGGSFDIGVARDMNIAVQGNFSVWANGGMNLQCEKKAHILSNDNMYIATPKQTHIQSKEEMFIESTTKSMHVTNAIDLFVSNGRNMHVNNLNDLLIHNDNDMHIENGKRLQVETGDQINFVSGGDFNVDASPNIWLNSGKSSPADTSEKSTPSVKALIHGMIPPPKGTPLYPDIEKLSPPPMMGEEKFMYESDVEASTKPSVVYNKQRTATEGKQNTYESEKATPTGGSGTGPGVTPRRDEILATDNFTADFKLSKHFTLGMLFDGGFNVRHRLQDQGGLTKQQIVCNLSTLCENILEKYLEVLPNGIAGYGKQWRITSGYRMSGSNVNSPTSDHPAGRACDITLINGGPERKQLMFDLIQQLDKLVSYDQLLLEYDGANSVWIHTSFRGNSNDVTFGSGTNRRMALTIKDHKTYAQGFTLLG